MKKIALFTLLSLMLFACGNKQNEQTLENLIETKNLKALNEKKTVLQAEIAKIEEALAKLDVKTEEALVTVATIKDTVFSHYLDIQGKPHKIHSPVKGIDCGLPKEERED